jgi:hypothetical protein
MYCDCKKLQNRRLCVDRSMELQPGPIPWGLLLLARIGDDPSMELQPGPLPWGLLLLARIGDDHSMELQPSPQQTGSTLGITYPKRLRWLEDRGK